MRYTAFRNLAIAGGVLLVGGTGYLCGHQKPPAQVTAAAPVPVTAPAPAAASVPPALPAPPAAAADYRTYLLGVLGKPAKGDKIKDALGRRQAKVNVYAEKGRWARAKVDLNRNDKWDEKWWVEDGSIMREVAPADDESYGAKTREGGAADRAGETL
jgi:hypothetical protein